MSKKSLPLCVGTKIKAKTASIEKIHTTATATTTTTTATSDIAKSSNLTGDISTTTTMQAVKIKKELPSDEIKEFAENTMNELLGWYGFDGVDRLDLSTKTSRLLQSAAVAQANNAALTAANSNNSSSSNNALSQQQRHCMEKRRSRSRAASLLQLQQQNEHMRNILNNNNNSNNNNSNGSSTNNTSNKNNNSKKNSFNCGGGGGSTSGVNHRTGNRGNASIGAGLGSGVGGGESTTSDHDTRSSREEDSKSPISAGKSTILEEKIDLQNCCWCRRPVPENAPEFLTTSDGPRYCSESCFTQSRRASFKKAKTCDWCKHVRHAISYVDFQDGASQLQFCSDKCLNQYKMQIFCKETQAHLDMNPHLREQGLEAVASGNGAGLITPDLWLRNCRSRSASPASTISVSPGPQTGAVVTHNSTAGIGTGSSSSPASSAASNLGTSTMPPHKPMISVAPASKLMSKNVGMLSSSPMSTTTNRVSPKHNRKKRPLRSSLSSNTSAQVDMSAPCLKGVLTRESSGLTGSTSSNASTLIGKGKSLLGSNPSNSMRTSPGVHLVGAGASCSSAKVGASALSQFAGSSVQDLHMSVPPLSPMLEQQTAPHVMPPHALNAGGLGATSIPPAFFATPTGVQPPNGAVPRQQMPHGAFPPHPASFLQNAGAPNAAGMLPRFFGTGGFPTFPLPPHVVQTPPDLMGGLGLGAILGAPPPVTVMVPYPIVIPLPIPIPVPLPVMDFYKAYLPPDERNKLNEKEAIDAKEAGLGTSTICEVTTDKLVMENAEREQKLEVGEETVSEEPLDFTKTKDLTQPKSIEDQQEDVASSSVHPLEVTQTQSKLKRALSNEHLTTRTTLSPTTSVTPTKATAVTPSTDRSSCSPATPSKATHCIVRSDETETRRRDINAEAEDAASSGGDYDGQKLPKFKITRLQTKRTLIQTKESPTTPTTASAECSRPLRKRKRIIDCDFQKLALREAAALEVVGDGEESADMHNVDADAKATTISVVTLACNSNTKAQGKK
ncbi:uncharacterized protein LOC101451604 isoform X1 [Ceratitis capitata]|nr:uncharacterized protein LOC101451604 isoform X1 [Ceratitis capitata]XP_012160638.1 uncharacterized protein LOC101451604 isoform X1 [Ceratitis capitata]XP_012160639.1 uncharacterized protein LOC101451604 isoform X1 [Ceratitis capitata]XP_012160640.1 uncharacterized protein LOC101451604 isoform X1 [Ceratitis capitata]